MISLVLKPSSRHHPLTLSNPIANSWSLIMAKHKPIQNQTESASVVVPPVAVDVPAPAVQDAPKEGVVVLSMVEEAKAEFGDILAFEQSRMTRWARVVKVHCVIPEDWMKYENLVKLSAVEYLAKQFNFKADLPRASWPEQAAEQWKGRFAPMFSNMSRIGKGLLSYEKKQVVAILEDTTKSYNAKLAELPRDTRGRKAGTVITPSASMTEGKEGTSKDRATGQASAQSLAATQLAAAVAGFTATCKAIENMNDAYISGMLRAVVKKLDSQLAPEWLNLSSKIEEACTEYDKRKVAEAKKKKDGKVEDSLPPEVESEPLTEQDIPEAAKAAA